MNDEKATMRPYENLTYEQAMQYLKEGVAVRLPEWNGIWFPIKDRIYVFTKDNEILSTPDHETYGQRNDWTTQHIAHLPERFVKGLRVRIDTILNYIKSELPVNRETSFAYTSAQTGFMWLGLYLADLGAANPYPKSMDPSSPRLRNTLTRQKKTTWDITTGHKWTRHLLLKYFG